VRVECVGAVFSLELRHGIGDGLHFALY
jgi:hypothetical protein